MTAPRGIVPARRPIKGAFAIDLGVDTAFIGLGQAQGSFAIDLGLQTSFIGTSTGIPGGVLAQVIINNTSASVATPAETYVTFGHAFKQGDIPSGSRVKIELTGGSTVRSQADLRNTWPDGSLRFAEISCQVASIAAAGTLTLNIKSESGIYNNTAVRTIAEIVAATDLKVTIANLRTYLNVAQGSGNWTCAFNTAKLTAANVEQIKSGPICDQWRVWGFFKDNVGGASHAHLNCIFYVTAWTKNDGTLGPISHINKVHQGWISIAAPTQLWYDAILKDGSTTIRDFKKQIVFDASVINTTTDQINFLAHGFLTGEPCTISSNGNLPPPAVANTLYWIRKIDADHFQMYTTADGASTGASGRLNFTGAGSGSHTVTRIIAQTSHTAWWTSDIDGLHDWTANTPEVFVEHDKTYLISTRLVPPYYTDTVVSPTDDSAPTPYGPQMMGRMRVQINGTGGTEHIGLMPQWCARALHSQKESYARDARANALMMAHINVQFRNEATGKIPALRGSASLGGSGDYAGLGTTKLTTQYYSTGTHSADVAVPTGGDAPIAWTTREPSHWPQALIYTILTEGGAHLIEAQIQHANYCLLWRGVGLGTGPFNLGTRTLRYSSSRPTHNGIVICSASNVRQDGWSLKCISDAAAVAPDNWSEKPYLVDVVNTNAAFAVELITNITPAFSNMGWWLFYDKDGITTWMQLIVFNCVCSAAAIHGGANFATWVDHMKKMPIAMAEGILVPCVLAAGTYKMNQKKTNAVTEADYITDWAEVGFHIEDSSVLAATDTFTREATTGSITWAIANGDKVKFAYFSAVGLTAQTPPAPLAYGTWYYVVQASGLTYKLSLTPGGAPINITEDKTSFTFWWRPSTCPVATNWTTADTYTSMSMAGLSFAMAYGASGCATARANIKAFNLDSWFLNQQPNGYSQPSWFLNSSYPA